MASLSLKDERPVLSGCHVMTRGFAFLALDPPVKHANFHAFQSKLAFSFLVLPWQKNGLVHRGYISKSGAGVLNCV
jgi:uncharacterized membrane protein